jgi:hypothetical protein
MIKKVFPTFLLPYVQKNYDYCQVLQTPLSLEFSA